MVLKIPNRYRKKLVLAVILLITPMWILFYSHKPIAETPKLIKAFGEYLNYEYTSSACAEELSSISSYHYVMESLAKDGFRPIALSQTFESTSTTTTQNGKIIRTTNSFQNSLMPTTGPFQNSVMPTTKAFLPTELTSKEASSKKREYHFLGLSEDCTKYRSGLTETKQAVVPNVVHYVFIGSDFEFKFMTYLSFLSVQRFLKPAQIFIHGNAIPSGKWWNVTLEQVNNIYHVERPRPEHTPNGQPFKFMAHVSDYMRAEILLRYGGIYLDPDVLVLKSFDPLRQFPFVLGRESGDSIGNGIIVARKDTLFLRLMLEQYWSYMGPDEEWAKQSVHNVHKLAYVYPHLIHVEETSLNRPNWMERSQIYAGNYNWTNNYAIHLWLRLWPKEKQPSGLEDIQSNTTIGEIVRHILFGTY